MTEHFLKRYRHYNKDLAIILSCFGSVIEQDKYLELEEYIREGFPETPVYTAFNSKMVLKLLKKKEGREFKTTIQTLADCDMDGYRRMVVASINLFPTSEHEELKKVVEGFNIFSPSNIRLTDTVFSTNKAVNKILKEIGKSVRDGDESIINLYVVHGAPELDLAGLASIAYAKELLKMLNPNNFFCSLEGSFAFEAIKDALIRDMLTLQEKRVQIVPLLLVSGNHFDEDVVEIQKSLGEHFDTSIAKSLTKSEKFNLIEMEGVRETIKSHIKDEIRKTGVK